MSASASILRGVSGTVVDEQRVLEQMLGPDATFRPGQLEAIEAVAVDRRPRPARPAHRLGQERRLLHRHAAAARRRAPGPTLLVSPLLALMRNQIEMAERDRRPRRDDQQRQPRRLGARSTQRSRADDASTCCWSRPSGSPTRAFRDDVLPDVARARRACS